MGILLIFNIPCITKRLDVINLIATTSKENQPPEIFDHGGPLPMGPPGPELLHVRAQRVLQQHDDPSLHKNGFLKWMMLPVGEREKHQLVEDLLGKEEEDKQHKNLPFMAQTHHDHTMCPQNGFLIANQSIWPAWKRKWNVDGQWMCWSNQRKNSKT